MCYMNLVQRIHFQTILFNNPFRFMELLFTRIKSFRRIQYKRMSHIQKKYLFAYFISIFPMMIFVYKENRNLVSWQLGRIFKRQKSHIVHKYFRLVKRLNPEILIFYIYHVQEI
jgi:hypothetical protein